MNKFLFEVSKTVMDPKTNLTKKKSHIVLGNEAADLDSVVSAIVLAYCLHKIQGADLNQVFIPIVNCKREDLPLRTEVVHWLRHHSIDLSSLLHREDLIRIWDQLNPHPTVTLVDHHNPDQVLGFLEPHVVEIFDHHALTGGGPWLQRCRNSKTFKVELVGSCATLIAEKVLAEVKEEDGNTREWMEIYSLLYGVILLDTMNLNPSFKKYLPLDVDILGKLENRMGVTSGGRVKIYREVEDAKFDVRDLSTTDLLRRDVKFIMLPHASAAVCSVAGLDYETFFKRPNLIEDLEKFCSNEGMKLCVVLTLGNDPNDPKSDIRRGLLLFHQTDSQSLAKELMEFLVKDTNLQLVLMMQHESSYQFPRLLVFSQGNSKLSRKYILPKVNTLLGNWSDQVTMEAMAVESDEPGLPTPLNSPSEIEEESVDRRLPSLNNRAMVEKVKEKREKHQQDKSKMVEPTPPPAHLAGSPASLLVSPECFTPENSRLVSPDEDHSRLHHLPSLNNKATVDLVAKKRQAGFLWPLNEDSVDSTIENMAREEDEAIEEEDERRVPFTPRNSLVEEGMFPYRASIPRGQYVLPELDSRHVDLVTEKRRKSLLEEDEDEG